MTCTEFLLEYRSRHPRSGIYAVGAQIMTEMI
jgi:hypothetical protein